MSNVSILQGNSLKNGDVITIRNIEVQEVENLIDLGDTPSSYDNGKYLQSTASGTVWSALETYATDEELATVSGYLDNKIDGIVVGSVNWDTLTGKPTTFTPASHGNEAHTSTYATEDYVDTAVSGVDVSDQLTTLSGALQGQIDTIELTPGPQGVPGLQGDPGHQGIQGEPGLQGIQGPAGPGFENIEDYATWSGVATISGAIVDQIPTNFYTTSEVDTISGALNTKINTKQDAGDYATNGELATVSGIIVSQIPTDFYTTGQVNTISGALNTKINTKADATHDHDSDYSDINHDHDTDYLSLNGGVVYGTVSISGDLVVSGTQFIAQVEDLLIEDHLLVINHGEVGAGISFPYAGIEVDRGSEDNYLFVFDEEEDNFQIGISGSLQPVATREEDPADGYVPYWEASEWRFKTTGSIPLSDIATVDSVATVSGALQDQIDNLDPLPDQTDNSGKYLTTDGTDASWAEVSSGDSLPDQTDNQGKFLTTDGTDASWASCFPEGNSNTMLIRNSDGELEWKQGLEIIKTYSPYTGMEWVEVEMASEGSGDEWSSDKYAKIYFRTGIDANTSDEYQVHMSAHNGFMDDTHSVHFYIQDMYNGNNDFVARKLEFPVDFDAINFEPGIAINGGQIITEFSTDGTLADYSDEKVPTQAAVRYYVDNFGGALPDQSGNDGKYLTTDGSDVSWAEVDALPDQSGYAGMVLTTNGSTAEWVTISGVTVSGSALVGDTSPQLGGDLDLNEHYIEYNPTPTSSGTGSGEIATMTVDANATGIGALLYIASDGNLELADASADTTMPGFALALESGTGSKKVLLRGFMRDDSWNWTPGGTLYASETTGAMTQTAPTTSEAQVQVLGIATHADRVWFNPSYGTVEVA